MNERSEEGENNIYYRKKIQLTKLCEIQLKDSHEQRMKKINLLFLTLRYLPGVPIDQLAPLGLDEVRQHVLVTPAGIIECPPGIVIGRRSPRVDHEVHHRGAADCLPRHYFATAVVHRQAVSALAVRVLRSRLALIHASVVRAVEDRRQIGDVREEDLVVALLEHQNPPVGILGQAIREHGSRRAGADHQEVEGQGVIGYLVLRRRAFRQRRET